MNCCALLFLLLICGNGNCGGQGKVTCCNHNHGHCHNHNNLIQPRKNGWECDSTCRKAEKENDNSECCCKENAGIIPPPWVRVDDVREEHSCGCDKH